MRRHVALARPILVLPQLSRDRAALAEERDDIEGIDPRRGTLVRNLDHDVDVGARIVDDAEADPRVVQPRRHVQICAGRIEPSAGMVVQQHFPTRRGAGNGQYRVDRAPSNRPGGDDHAITVHLTEERHFAPSRRGDLAARNARTPGASRSITSSVLSSWLQETGRC